MKIKHLIIAVALLVAAQVKAGTYNISGTWTEGEGQMVYLQTQEGQGSERVIDTINSALVVNGKFSMTGTFENAREATFRAGTTTERFWLNETPMIVTCGMVERERRGEVSLVFDVEVKGGVEQEMYTIFTRTRSTEQIVMLGLAFASAREDADRGEIDTAVQVYMQLMERNKRLYDSLIETNPDAIASAFMINTMHTDWGLEKTEEMFNPLTARVKASSFGKSIQEAIDIMRAVAQGAMAPDFTLIDIDNKPLKLSDYRGKYVLIDFWGSWCGPCRRTHPKLVELHAKYGGEKFEILGLASERETDGVKWKDAIAAGGLTWPQVNLTTNETGQDVLKTYNVYGFPTKVLVDPKGEIVVTYVGSSADLEDRLKEIFGR